MQVQFIKQYNQHNGAAGSVGSSGAQKSSHALQAASELKLQKSKFGARRYDIKVLISPHPRGEQSKVSSAMEFAFLW